MPSQVLLALLVLLFSVIGINLGAAFQSNGVRPCPPRATPPPAQAAASSEQDRQRMRLLFPPTTRPTSIVYQDRGIWTFEQPFYTTTNIKTRMSLVDLNKDAILMYAPIAATPECVEMVQRATGGRLPTHIIMHSDAIDHTIFLDGWRRAAPQAQILAVKPDTGKGDVPLVAEDASTELLKAQLPAALTKGGALASAVFDCRPFFQEVILFHRPSRSLLCADAIWRVVSPRFSPNVIAASGWRGFGVADRSAHPYWFYLPRRRKEEVRAFLREVESWGEVRRVLPGHLDPIPTEGEEGMGSAEVKRTFLESFDYIVR